MNKRIYLSPPDIGDLERKYVKEAFDLNWIAPVGPHLDLFEKKLGKYIGNRYVAALSSGTAAIHLALILLNVQQGDDVLVQSFTFCGSVNPVKYLGANPILIGSEKDTWNMDPEALEVAIKECKKNRKKPKAIIYVHLYGIPAKIDELEEIANRYSIPTIEDAAEALGSEYKGKKAGSFGTLSVVSFNGNKIITTGGGGALLSENEEIIKQAKFLATQARDPAPHYQHSILGYNYRLSNVSAAIGLGQLEQIDEKVKKRRMIFEIYRDRLRMFPSIEFLDEGEGVFSNRWLTTLKINKNDQQMISEIQINLEEANIESRPLWKPMHLQPLYIEELYYGNDFAEKLFKSGLCLPSGSKSTHKTINQIIEIIIENINKKR